MGQEEWSKQLRQAGDKAAGPISERKALDATEQLVFSGLMTDLGWLEGVAADRGNPIRRLASAEFRLLGSLLGLLPPEQAGAASSISQNPSSNESTSATNARGLVPHARSADDPPRIRHVGTPRRAVHITQWDFALRAEGRYPLTFYSDKADAPPFECELVVGSDGGAVLNVSSADITTAGSWRAAICDASGLQLGSIAVDL